MGSGQASEVGILKKSPLGCLLKHWKGVGGDLLTRKQLIEYCNHWWPMYILGDQEKQPKNGTLKYDITIKVVLLVQREMGMCLHCLKYGRSQRKIPLDFANTCVK